MNCGVLPDEAGGQPLYRFWVDPTYAVSFWEVLTQTAGELGGRVVGRRMETGNGTADAAVAG